ncbi:MAG: CDP-diacylglycerol--glycerol-3-phosphate 3-phosphatidyltransferase [Syntrophus sp. (in: bacteria)]|nr:CDP-diacylglycerol--glycerol-3-phosphate 3-phosphatidyltransferase [Syntrophus sp. (in: bacteria)]
MNIPNLISIFRIFITIFFILAVHKDRFIVAFYLFIFQGLTDMLDGFLARVMSKKTDLGAFLDPIADKTMLVAGFVMLSIKGIVPLWLTMLVILKDVVVVTGFLALYKLAYTTKPVPSVFGKITTVCQIATILYILWSGARAYGDALFYVTAFFTTLSGLHYVYVGIRMLRGEKVTQSPAGN